MVYDFIVKRCAMSDAMYRIVYGGTCDGSCEVGVSVCHLSSWEEDFDQISGWGSRRGRGMGKDVYYR
jgi:hypothetical protein